MIARSGSFVTFPLLVKYLGAEAYGVQAQAGAINGVLIPIATIGLGFSVVRLLSGHKDVAYVSTRFWTTLILVVILSSFLAAIVFFTAPVLNYLFIKVDYAASIIRWSAPLIILTAINMTIGDYYRARLRVFAFSIFQMLGTVANIAGTLSVLMYGGSLLEVVQITVVVQIIFNLCLAGYLVVCGEITVQSKFMSHNELMEMIRFGLPIIVMGIGVWSFSISDRIIIGYYLDSITVGVYNGAFVLGSVLVALASPFLYALYPLMAIHHNDGDRKGLCAVCRKYSTLYCIIGFPALAGIILLSKDILPLLGTAEFSIHTLIFGLLAMGIFSDQFSANAHYLIYLHNEPRFIRNVTIMTGLFNIGLNILIIPSLGILGAALSSFTSYLMLDLFLFRKVINYGYRFGDLYDLRALGKIVLCTFFMSMVVFILKSHFASGDIKRLIILISVGVVFYSFVLLAINRFNISRFRLFASGL